MSLGARLFRNERIGHFLYAVVREPPGAIRADNQLLLESFPQVCLGLLFGCLKNSREGGGTGAVSNAGKLLERLLSRNGKSAQLVHHEVHHVVGITLNANGIQLPAPASLSMLE